MRIAVSQVRESRQSEDFHDPGTETVDGELMLLLEPAPGLQVELPAALHAELTVLLVRPNITTRGNHTRALARSRLDSAA